MKRAIACLIDSAIIETIFKLIVSGIVTHNTPYTGVLLSISLLVFHVGYFFLADWGWDGCSIGKKLTGIRTIVPPDKRNLYLATHGTLKTIFLAFFSDYHDLLHNQKAFALRCLVRHNRCEKIAIGQRGDGTEFVNRGVPANPQFRKTRVRKLVSWKAVGRARQLQFIKAIKTENSANMPVSERLPVS